MKKVIICKGLPASGKSTYAKQLVKENKGMYKRINKDDLRMMLDGSAHSKANEKFIVKTRDWLIVEALRDGKYVIVDDTNLASRHEVNIRNLVTAYCKETGQQVHVEVKWFDTPLEECIKRDLNRMNSVGESVIRRLHRQFIEEKEMDKIPKQDRTLPKAIICDLDGTLALMNGRNPYNAQKCEDDLLNVPVANVVSQYEKLGYKIILLSGRHDTYKPETISWLENHKITYHSLIMRRAKDQRKDAIVKREFYEEEVQNKFYVEMVLDDRNQVVDMWRKELGLTCFQVNYGDF